MSSEHLDAIINKYSEHLEMFGVSQELLVKILVHELEKEKEKTKYLERRLQIQKVKENKTCKC